MMQFTKMHGLGNDFIMVEGPNTVFDQVEIARLCDRHTGIGADGLIIVTPVDKHSVKMEYWNSDGTEAEMCGNGLRCVVRFAVEHEMVKPGEILVQTPAGPLKTVWDGSDYHAIEVQVGTVIDEENTVDIEGLTFHTATVGNPHAIAYVDDLDAVEVAAIGPVVELDQAFPNKTNVEFVEVASKDRIRIGIWERGSGQTLACGTGMVSCAVVSQNLSKIQLPATVEVPGGSAKIWIDDEGYTRMLGPAEVVFSGSIGS